MKRIPASSLLASTALGVCLVIGCTATVAGGAPGNGTGNRGGAGAGTGAAGANGAGGGGIAGDPTAAGARPLRLLSAREYLNTVRDLLGDSTTMTADALPSSDEDRAATPSFAFRVDHDVATQDGALLEAAAESIAKNAVGRLTTILPCAAPPAAAQEAACLSTFLANFLPKAYRRPVDMTGSEVMRLNDLYALGRGTLALGFNDAIGLLIEAILQSPQFLYHWEQDPTAAPIKDGAVLQLGDYELANRLSYFLWESMPDATLFAAAAARQLATTAGVEAQVRRMLKDPKAGPAMVDFFNDWLDTDVLPEMSKDQTQYPMYNDALVAAMGGEVQNLITGVVMNGSGRLGDLLTGTSSYANQALAALYGISGVTGTALRAVTLNPAERSGLLTSAAFLATTGDAAQSNPPRRGKAIYTKLLCGQLNPLPAVVPPPPPASQGGTLRQRMQMHDMAACTKGCHDIIEPFGFAFEEYGGIGEFRTTDNMLPVDASGTVPLDGRDHAFTGAPGLMAALAASPTVQSCFATQWLRYGVGRFETAGDRASLDAATTAFGAAGGDIRELLVALLTSRTFRYRAPAAGEVVP